MNLWFEITLICYVVGGVNYYLQLRAALRDLVGPGNLTKEHKRKALRRSLLWFLPSRIFYYKDVAWEEEKQRYEASHKAKP